MKTCRLEVATFPVPFRRPFSHASATRKKAENVIVKVVSDEGVTGFGEGCPREYVTWETVDSARRFLRDHAADAASSISSIDDLRKWSDDHSKEIDVNPAAFCALEVALLDCMARSQKVSIEGLLDFPELDRTQHQYTGVIGSGRKTSARLLTLRYLVAGLTDFKVKLSDSPALDLQRLSLLRLWPFRRVRFDANNLWNSSADCITHMKQFDGLGFAIEEPLTAGDIDGFREVALHTDMAIILDESFLSPSMLERLPGGVDWIVNVRVSKLGGILRALEAVRAIKGHGHGVIVGAHVGETGILTRAALPVARSAGRNLVAQEGAFGTYLLLHDLTRPSPRFGLRGRIPSKMMPGRDIHGLGLEVNETLLEVREKLM